MHLRVALSALLAMPDDCDTVVNLALAYAAAAVRDAEVVIHGWGSARHYYENGRLITSSIEKTYRAERR